MVMYHLHFWTVVLLQEQSSAELILVFLCHPARVMMMMCHILVCEGAGK